MRAAVWRRVARAGRSGQTGRSWILRRISTDQVDRLGRCQWGIGTVEKRDIPLYKSSEAFFWLRVISCGYVF